MQAVKKLELTDPAVLTSLALASPLFPLLGTPVLLEDCDGKLKELQQLVHPR